MEYEEGLIGQVVRHKLLGKCIILKTPKPTTHYKDPMWEVRLKNGTINTVHPAELVKLNSKAEKLRRWAIGAKYLSYIAIKEANELDGVNLDDD